MAPYDPSLTSVVRIYLGVEVTHKNFDISSRLMIKNTLEKGQELQLHILDWMLKLKSLAASSEINLYSL